MTKRVGGESRHPYEYDAAKPNQCKFCGRRREAHKTPRASESTTPACKPRPGVSMGEKWASPHARFMAKVLVDYTTGCWLWTASLDRKGYAKFGRPAGDGWALGHRWSYAQRNGPIPDGLQIDHLCRIPHCVNPDHLEAVTQKENARRARGIRKARCLNGHSLDDARIYRGTRGETIRQCRSCQKDREKRYQLVRKASY